MINIQYRNLTKNGNLVHLLLRVKNEICFTVINKRWKSWRGWIIKNSKKCKMYEYFIDTKIIFCKPESYCYMGYYPYEFHPFIYCTHVLAKYFTYKLIVRKMFSKTYYHETLKYTYNLKKRTKSNVANKKVYATSLS